MFRSLARVSRTLPLRRTAVSPATHTFQHVASYSDEAIAAPVTADVKVSPKIEELVDSISKLTLIEVADLSALLKERLNIADAPVMMGAVGGAAPAAAGEPEEQKAEQTEFTVKLTSFDASSKVKLIKEIRKSALPDMNLVQVKKFLEGEDDRILKQDIPKAEAEELKALLEASGAQIEIV